MNIFKSIHYASKDLNSQFKEYNIIPFLTYIFFFIVFSFIFFKKYLTKLFNNKNNDNKRPNV